MDTERDAGLIRQYEGGLARTQSARSRCYNKYLPDLTEKEKRWLGIDEKGLAKTEALVKMVRQGDGAFALRFPYVRLLS